jgi:hypothetical protein
MSDDVSSVETVSDQISTNVKMGASAACQMSATIHEIAVNTEK